MTVQSSSQQPNPSDGLVETKRSGGGLALFVALLSLLASGYLWYQNWQTSQNITDPADGIATIQQQLNDTDNVLSTKLTNIQADVAANAGKLGKLEQLINQQQSSTTPESVTFDNQANLAQFEALTQRMVQQDKLINQLQRAVADAPQSTANLTTVDNSRAYQIQAAIQQLMVARLLLENNQLDAANKSLEIAATALTTLPSIAKQIQAVNTQLSQLKVPDGLRLNQQLTELSNQVSGLVLKVETVDTQSSPWYERFISVKKISNTSKINSSAELAILKANLSQHLVAAKLALILQDQNSWQQQLSAAVQLLQDQSPDEAGLLEQLQSMSEQQVRIEIPSRVDLAAIVAQLREQR